ncbi:amino acid/polyamine transporter [Reticulomyxa filosa]|uniref:Amino acid/polyamine transporter n=1 Tax=Reticulomyxa filosa TaxID=46433 RepID=X6NQU2_RETFI|nr:amino acid/polyamine transporter [Reticulomyxa filosa]|eukprot:ETO28288.1 amino acid/polyamine transporter [Reticulomyxa filosa]
MQKLNIIPQHIYKERRIWISVFVITLILPIVRWRYLDNLRYVSSFCLGFFAFVVATIFLYAYGPESSFNACQNVTPPCPGNIALYPTNAKNFLGVLPLFIFGFTCHQNAFTITNELKSPTHARLNIVVYSAMLCCFIIYSSSSFAGYQTFGSVLDKNNSDVLKLYPETWITTIVRLLLSMNLSLSYPLQCNPCRNCLSQLIFGKSALELDDKRFYMLTYGITCGSWMLALVVNSLGVVLAIVGSTGSTTISYILPGLFYYLTFKNDKTNKMKYLALALAILGCCVVPFALNNLLRAKKKGENKQWWMFCLLTCATEASP